MRCSVLICCLSTMLMVMASCGDSATPHVVVEPAKLPADLFVTAAPANPRSVDELRKDAKEGDEVTVLGRIGGRLEPFSADRTIVLIVDRALPSCTEGSPMEGCKTPWDFCCDDPTLLAKSVATVQVVDESGKPIKGRFEGSGGMKPLSEIVVQGKVTKKDENTLVINASRIFVKG